MNLRIFNCIGSKCTIYAPLSLTFADVKRKVVAEFHARRQLFATPQSSPHHHQVKLTSVPVAATAAAPATTSSCRDRFEDRQQQKQTCDNLDLVQLSRHYKLARISRLHEHFDEQCSLATANVQNNEEMLLVLCNSMAAAVFVNAHTKDVNSYANPPTQVATAMSVATKTMPSSTTSIAATLASPTESTATNSVPTAAAASSPSQSESSSTNVHKYYFNCGSESDSDDDEITMTTTSTSTSSAGTARARARATTTTTANSNMLVPTQRDIDLATENEAVRTANEPNVVNIDELVSQSDVQYDIRKILISLANSCAYVIGSGPYATRIISMLKQRLVQRKQHEQDTQQCLIEMGFSRPKVQHALNINK